MLDQKQKMGGQHNAIMVPIGKSNPVGDENVKIE